LLSRSGAKPTHSSERVFEWLGQKGVECAGQPPFFRYWVIGDMDNKFELEVGVPVRNAVSGDGRVIAGSIPGGTYATLVHTGHPDRLIHSLTALQDWGISQGLEWNNRREGNDEVWGGRFEFYLTNPAEQPDLEQWSIEIAYQVRDDTVR
jgi:DNA gyrase inhibitor GyrI